MRSAFFCLALLIFAFAAAAQSSADLRVQRDLQTWPPSAKAGQQFSQPNELGLITVTENGTAFILQPPAGLAAYFAMNAFTKTFQHKRDDRKFMSLFGDSIKTNWRNSRDIFCDHYRGAHYAELDGSTATCHN